MLGNFGGSGSNDPFNYPMPSRKDLMSLSTITPLGDNMKTTTRKFQSGRADSSNLTTGDISGKNILIAITVYRCLT